MPTIKCLCCGSTNYTISGNSYLFGGKRFIWYQCNKCKAEYSHQEQPWTCSAQNCGTLLIIEPNKTYLIKNKKHEIGHCTKCNTTSYRPVHEIPTEPSTLDLTNNIETETEPEPEPIPEKLFIQKIKLNKTK